MIIERPIISYSQPNTVWMMYPVNNRQVMTQFADYLQSMFEHHVGLHQATWRYSDIIGYVTITFWSNDIHFDENRRLTPESLDIVESVGFGLIQNFWEEQNKRKLPTKP